MYQAPSKALSGLSSCVGLTKTEEGYAVCTAIAGKIGAQQGGDLHSEAAVVRSQPRCLSSDALPSTLMCVLSEAVFSICFLDGH